MIVAGVLGFAVLLALLHGCTFNVYVLDKFNPQFQRASTQPASQP